MMNQPGSLPGMPPTPPVAAGRPAPGVVPPPGAGAIPNKLKGTMVGVAPMAGGPLPPPPFAPMTPPPGAAGASPLPPPHAPPGAEAASAFSPPVPQPGVNPLGGTVAADAGVFGAFAAQQHAPPAGYGGGAPPAYGAPPGPTGGTAPPGPGQTIGTSPMYAPYGTPPYGAAPQQQPGAPPPFGVPPPPGMPGAPPYGAPQPYGGPDAYAQPHSPGGYGQPMPMAPMGGPGGQAMVPHQHSGSMVGTLKSSSGVPIGPTRRNALLTLLLPLAVMFGGTILSIVLAFAITPALGSLASLFVLGGSVWYLLLAIQMVAELKSVTRSDELAWWPLIVPIYQLYFMWLVVPQEVAKAKQLLGARKPPQPVVLYIFLWHFALASDLNDLVR
jgi:hypothetical protein